MVEPRFMDFFRLQQQYRCLNLKPVVQATDCDIHRNPNWNYTKTLFYSRQGQHPSSAAALSLNTEPQILNPKL